MKILKLIPPFIIFLLTLEIFSGAWLNYQKSASEKWHVEWKQLREGETAKRPHLASLKPGALISQTITSPDGKKNEVLYEINEFGLRGHITAPVKKKSHLLVSGDSYVYGQGISEDETLTSNLSRLRPDLNIWNLGWTGGSMHTAFRFFDLLNPREYAPEDEGTLIYVFENFHVHRWLLIPRVFRYQVRHFPTYKEVDGKFIFQGEIGDFWQWKLFRIMNKSFFGKVVSDALMDVGTSYNERDVHLYFNAIQEFKRRYKEIYPRGRFVVVTHPLQQDYNFIPAAKKESEARGIEYFDSIPEWKSQHPENNEAFLVPGDGHPIGLVNEFLSEFIDREVLSTKRDSR